LPPAAQAHPTLQNKMTRLLTINVKGSLIKPIIKDKHPLTRATKTNSMWLLDEASGFQEVIPKRSRATAAARFGNAPRKQQARTQHPPPPTMCNNDKWKLVVAWSTHQIKHH